MVNEYHVHVVSESCDSAQKKCLHVVHFNVLCDWFELNLWHQKHYSEGGKKNCGWCSLLGTVKTEWLYQRGSVNIKMID